MTISANHQAKISSYMCPILIEFQVSFANNIDKILLLILSIFIVQDHFIQLSITHIGIEAETAVYIKT